MSKWPVLMSAVGFMLLSSCTTCYSERFCRELVGLRKEQVITILGSPTQTLQNGKTEVWEWAYNDTHLTSVIVPGYADVPVGYYGRLHPIFVPSYERIMPVLQVAVLRLSFVRKCVTGYSYMYDGDGMCNFFIPQNYLERYRAEDMKCRD